MSQFAPCWACCALIRSQEPNADLLIERLPFETHCGTQPGSLEYQDSLALESCQQHQSIACNRSRLLQHRRAFCSKWSRLATNHHEKEGRQSYKDTGGELRQAAAAFSVCHRRRQRPRSSSEFTLHALENGCEGPAFRPLVLQKGALSQQVTSLGT